MTQAETVAPLPDRRAATVARLAELEREAGAALLDAGEADGGPLLALHGELAVLDAASLEAERRQRATDEAEAHAARVEAAKEAAAELEAFRVAVAAVEKHATALATELKAIMGHARVLKSVSPRLGIRPPMILDTPSMAKALSLALGEALSGTDRDRAFGYLNWPSSPRRQGWDAVLQPVTEGIEPVIEGLTA